MTNEKELKSEFAKTFNLDILVDDPRANRYVSLKANDILDFFLSKFHSHTQELVAKIEGMKKEYDPDCSYPTFSPLNDPTGIDGYSQALDDVLALLKEDNKPQKTAGTWKGKELNEMSKEELIKALEHLNGLYMAVLEDNNK